MLSTRQTAWAEIPFSAPSKPKCSVVVAFTLTQVTSMPMACASILRISVLSVAVSSLPVDGVLPFLVNHDTAGARLKEWVDQTIE